jgi:hypothetical protein
MVFCVASHSCFFSSGTQRFAMAPGKTNHASKSPGMEEKRERKKAKAEAKGKAKKVAPAQRAPPTPRTPRKLIVIMQAAPRYVGSQHHCPVHSAAVDRRVGDFRFRGTVVELPTRMPTYHDACVGLTPLLQTLANPGPKFPGIHALLSGYYVCHLFHQWGGTLVQVTVFRS